MGDIGETWRAFNEESKRHRRDKQEWSKELLVEWCNNNDVVMVEVTEWQLRLAKNNITLDIYPQRQKYHLIKPIQERGTYKALIQFVQSKLI